MTDKLELKSSHEVVYTVDVADVDSIFYCKPTDPDILTVLMKDGKRLYCDEVCPIDSLQEEPVSKPINFEKELYKAFGQVKDFTLCMQIAKWFYDMGKNSQEPVSEELEEASKNYALNNTPWDDCKDEIQESFRVGAQWHKEQLMAKAIDGHATFEFYGLDSKTYGTIAHDPVCFEDLGLKDTDKVKVIVIKED